MAFKTNRFRVISPMGFPSAAQRDEEEFTTMCDGRENSQSAHGDGREGLNEGNVATELPRGENVRSLRAQFDRELERLERERSRTVRELEDERTAARRQAEQATKEKRRLTVKLDEEVAKCRELAGKLAEERQRTRVVTRDETERRLLLAEERCRELEKAMDGRRNPTGVHLPADFSQPAVVSAARGDVGQLQQMVAATGCSVTAVEKDGTTAAHAAAQFGNSGCLAILLDNRANAGAIRPADKATPLHLAASNGHSSCVELLLECSIDMNAVDKRGNTSLMLSAENGQLECVWALVKRGASLGVTNKAGRSALHLATAGGHYQCLMSLARHGERQGILKQLVAKPDGQGWTPVHLAANKGYGDCLSLLVSCPHVDVTLQDNWGRTPQDLAATSNCKELFNNKAFKPVVVKIHGEDVVSVGIARIQAHHQWNDFDKAIQNVLTAYSSFVNGSLSPSTNTSSVISQHPRVPSIPIEEPSRGESFQTFHSPPLTRSKEASNAGRESDSGHHNGSASSSSGSASSVPWHARSDSAIGEEGGDEGSLEGGLGLNGDSVAFYECGSLRWIPGGSPAMSGLRSAKSRLLGTPPPFLVFGGILPGQEESSVGLEVILHLKGMAEGKRFDFVANDSLVPIPLLRSYLELLESTKAVILCGPPGTDKSRLARLLGDTLKAKVKRDQEAEVTHIVLTPAFTRGDLLYVLHSKGFLVSADASSPLKEQPAILILDDMHRISLPEVMAELLTALNYRGPQNGFWLSAVGRPGYTEPVPQYREGRYYLKKHAYVIGTMDKHGSTNVDMSFHHCFRWIMCQHDMEPIKGLLRRELRRRLLDLHGGQMPAPNDTLFGLVEWIWRIWRRLNVCAVRLQIPELSLGPRLFFSCPLVKDSPHLITKWLSDLWNFGVVPCVQDVVLRTGGASAADLGADQAATPVLITMICKAVVPGCPLPELELRRFVDGLHGYSEGHQLLHEIRIKTVGEKSERRVPTPSARRKTPSPQNARKAMPPTESPRVFRRVATAPANGMSGYNLQGGGGGGGNAPVGLVPLRANVSPLPRRREAHTMYEESPPSLESAASPIRHGNTEANSGKKGVPVVTPEAPDEGKVRRAGSRAGDFARRIFGRLRGRSRTKGTPKLLRKEMQAAEEEARVANERTAKERQRLVESRSATASPSLSKSRSTQPLSPTKSNVSRSSSTGHMKTAMAATIAMPVESQRKKKSNSIPPEKGAVLATRAAYDSPVSQRSQPSSRLEAPQYRSRSQSDASLRKRSKTSNDIIIDRLALSDSDDDHQPTSGEMPHNGRMLNAVVTVADVHVSEEESASDERRTMSRRRAQSFTSGSAANGRGGGQRNNRLKPEPKSEAPRRRGPSPRLASQV
eukprot:m.49362 g.49362  ORF g.49362 m.49362 type:complete len:1367 (+) comp33976_c0_seq1:146-4246(+)